MDKAGEEGASKNVQAMNDGAITVFNLPVRTLSFDQQEAVR